jgi:hypothetical protein
MANSPRYGAMSGEHRFFLGYALVAAAVLVIGFAPSYIAPLLGIDTAGARVPAPLVVHLHGIVFFAYTALYVSQTWLAAHGDLAAHRYIGARLGLPVLVALLLAGLAISLWGPDRDATRPDSIAFLAWLAGDLVMIALFMGAALWQRHDSATHKRLMALAMAVMTSPGLGRILGWLDAPAMIDLWGPPILFGLALVGWDMASRGRLHPATAWGIAILALSEVLRIAAMQSTAWHPAGAALLESVG